MNSYKIIDCHAHIFHEKIAKKAIENLENYYKMKWNASGTEGNLLKNMDEAGVSKAVIFSTATKGAQVENINTYMSEFKNDRFIPFGTFHAEYEDYKKEIDRMEAFGFKGIKFHNDFQRFNIDDDRMLKVYEYLEEKDFVLMFHTGDETLDFSSPLRIARVNDMFPKLKIISAHFGGCAWDDQYKCLLGRNVYFDTSSAFWSATYEKCGEIIKEHGYEKVLFATDYPRVTHKAELEEFMKIPLGETEREHILYKNAAKLFEIDG